MWESKNSRTFAATLYAMSNTFFYTGIRCSANMGCLNGYDSIPFKDMFKYVGVMSDIEKLVDDISLLMESPQ